MAFFFKKLSLAGSFVNAIFNTSSIVLTGIISTFANTSFDISMRSLLFKLGIITFFIPPRCAANNFYLRPPMGKTSPLKVISPVMATSDRTGMLVSDDMIAVVIPIPALGPSFGVAASGK